MQMRNMRQSRVNRFLGEFFRKANQPKENMGGIKRLFSRALWYAYIAISYFFSRKSEYRFVFVISTARSGSNVLIQALDSYDEIVSMGEPLHAGLVSGLPQCFKGVRLFSHYIKSVASVLRPKKWIAMKLDIDQLKPGKITVSQLAREFPDSKFIILYRQNLAEQYVSHQIALKTDAWTHDHPNNDSLATVRIEPDELATFCNWRRRQYSEVVKTSFLPGQHLLLSYEDFSNDLSRGMTDRIDSFLGLSSNHFRVSLEKQSHLSPREKIENYEQLDSSLLECVCRLRLGDEENNETKD